MSYINWTVVMGTAMLATTGMAVEPSPFKAFTGGAGCTIEQVTNAVDPEYQVQGVSWDGQWLAYSMQPEGSPQGNDGKRVYLLDLQSGEKREMHESATNSGAFSPDGRYLVGAFEKDDERTDIWEIDLETNSLRAIAPHEQWDWLPSYSPDGSTIVFNSYCVEGQSEIFLFDRQSGTLTQMTDNPAYDAHGEFSPDGERILFHRMISRREGGGYDFELFTIDVATGEETQLTKGSPFEESYASWAPDSEHVVFSSDVGNKPEKHNLYVLGPKGDVVSRLTSGDWKDSYAFWTRDGKYIYFNSERGGTTNIYRIPMDGIACKKT